MRAISAGIICYARAPDGNVHLLLGRERDTPGWKQGSRRWSSFSGKIEPNEDVVEAAAREFLEETCAVVPLTRKGEELRACSEAPVSIDEIVGELRGQENRRIERVISLPGESFLHVSFVREIEFLPFHQPFVRTRSLLLGLDTVIKAYCRAKKTLEHTPRMTLPGYCFSTLVVATDFEIDSARPLARVTVWDGTCARVIELVVSEQAAVEMRPLQHQWQAVLAFMEKHPEVLSHPAVQLSCQGGMVVSAHVNKSYLEKSEMAWWSVQSLKQACRMPWSYSSMFRKHFYEFIGDIVTAIPSIEDA